MTGSATQGHTYTLDGRKVMAMESGTHPVVHAVNHLNPWPLTYIGRVNASSLKPLPMVYFNNEVPR